MPFLIPLIPVLTGAITGLAAELAIGAAVVGGLGYVAKDQDLMKVGGLLGIASLGFGIAGARRYGNIWRDRRGRCGGRGTGINRVWC